MGWGAVMLPHALESYHTFRYSFATHRLERGQDARTIQERIGHSDLNTTMIDTHVLMRGLMRAISPANQLVQPLQGDIGSDHHCSRWAQIAESDCCYKR